ncbi:MAG: flagellin [Cohaesibacter sp.]|jgi:flagellin-like hook-associated protein FlgL|nr:flagellin [Cohaesibacter sp.]
MSDITLSAGVRQNLLSLQKTADMMSATQNKLATGKKVNSALDNPNNFFTSKGLSTRANELSNLLDGIGNTTKTLEAADNGIKAITKLVESAQSTVRQAQQANNQATATHIQGNASIDTSGSSGSNVKERVENQTLTALGFAQPGGGNDSNITITSTDDKGNTKTFDLQAHFTASGKSFLDGNGAEAGTDDYTVKNLVDDINSSGVATASITDDGRLDIKANGNKTLQFVAFDADAVDATTQSAATSVATKLGFATNANVNGDDGAGGGGVTDPGGTAVTFADGSADSDGDTLTITNQAAKSNADNKELVSQFNEILDQIDELAADSSYNGVNLINGGGNDLTVAFNEKRDSGKSELKISSVDLTSSGLSVTDASSLGADEANLKLDDLSNALTSLRKQSSTFGSNLNTVKIRQEFTKDSITTLQTGADALVLADSNEEGANMLALQTRQTLSTTALSLASQADQAVTRFLRA